MWKMGKPTLVRNSQIPNLERFDKPFMENIKFELGIQIYHSICGKLKSKYGFSMVPLYPT